ncbi:MAG TPA: fructosamine kinase family protein, partial [Chromatiales bacterium]|nr:fructosamine kinase family protein [Chromatiales bacterium]
MRSAPESAFWPVLAERIARATGRAFAVHRNVPLGGGCINTACRIEGDGERYFVKLNRAARLGMFEAEAEGLGEMGRSAGVRVPRPICSGVHDECSFLVLEYLDLDAAGDARASERLGRQLATMHRTTRTRFGWHRDNTIGSTPQENAESEDWVAFWRERRLRFQLELAAHNGYGGRLQARAAHLLDAFPALFEGYRPIPSLLHGDLWGGNFGVTRDGEPVLFDPATYYGDREADLAMTELFGGFGPRFYAAYREAFPLDPGYRVRRTLYNLYHILNHLNLFGAGYYGQAEAMI